MSQPVAHDFPFDPTYGYDLDALLAIPAPPEPEGFDPPWRRLYDRARRVDVAAEVSPLEAHHDGVRVFGLSYRSVDDVRLGGWLVLPDGPVERGLVIGHGYGGREAPDLPLPVPGAAAVFPCARGLPVRGRVSGIPEETARHVLHGIGSRDRYVLGGCVADLWCAATALLELVPSIGRRLGYVGVSFGGGIGALALPWDDRFIAAHLTVPTFGHHPLRLTMPGTGSGESVRQYHAGHPEVIDVLRHFDAATAATRITIPVQVAPALFDPVVPPPGQFAVYNALPGPRDLVILATGHVENEGSAAQQQSLLAAQRRFLSAHLG